VRREAIKSRAPALMPNPMNLIVEVMVAGIWRVLLLTPNALRLTLYADGVSRRIRFVVSAWN